MPLNLALNLPTILAVIGIAIPVLLLYSSYMGKLKKQKKIANVPKGFIALGMVVILGLSLVQVGVGSYISPALAPFAVITPAVPGVPDVPGVPALAKIERVIDTFSVQAKEFGSNSWKAVGNASDGFLKVFPPDQDPADPTAEYIVQVNITSGTGEDTTKALTTDTSYRLAFDGGGKAGWYDIDFGVVELPFKNFNPATGTFIFKIGDGDRQPVYRISLIDDIFDETDISGDINGQTNVSYGSGQVGFEISMGTGNAAAADDTVFYNETHGDGAFYFHIDPALSKGNQYIKNYVICFDHDDSNPPDGAEYSAFTSQLISGTDLGFPSDLLNYWVNEMCLTIPNEYQGTFSSKYKFSITVTEGNLDPNDVWTLRADDLGKWQGKDIVLNTGAKYETITFDSH